MHYSLLFSFQAYNTAVTPSLTIQQCKLQRAIPYLLFTIHFGQRVAIKCGLSNIALRGKGEVADG